MQSYKWDVDTDFTLKFDSAQNRLSFILGIIPTAPAVPCGHAVPCRPPSPSVAEVAAAVAQMSSVWKNWPLTGSSATTDQALTYNIITSSF